MAVVILLICWIALYGTKHHPDYLFDKDNIINELNEYAKLFKITGKWIRINDPYTLKPLNIHVAISEGTTTSISSPIVFVHGNFSCSAKFFPIMQHLFDTSGSRCISIDLPGYGISDTPEWSKDMSNQLLCEYYTEIIRSIIEVVSEGDPVVLVAHSIGCYFSIGKALESSHLIKAFIFTAPAGLLPVNGDYAMYWAYLFKFSFPQVALIYLRHILYPLTSLLSASSQFWLCHLFNPHVSLDANPGRFIKIEAMRSYWMYPKLHEMLKINKPVILVYGEHDSIVPSHQGHVISNLTGGVIESHIIKNEGHFLTGDTFTKEITVIINKAAKGYGVNASLSPCVKHIHAITDVIHQTYCAKHSPSETRKEYELLYDRLAVFARV
jgi:pimeloyl-ACP methyl ester carboxylesterase